MLLRYEPDGEFGHITEGRLLAIPQADFDEALRRLEQHDLPVYEERVYEAVAVADTGRWSLSDRL